MGIKKTKTKPKEVSAVSSPPAASFGIPPGVVMAYAGDATNVPPGWLLCNGASVSRSDYAALFAVIGTKHGVQDGSHFNLPDCQGKFVRGTNNGGAWDPDAGTRVANPDPGKGGGNTGDNVGSLQFEDFASHTHTQNSHNHTQNSHSHTTNFGNYNVQSGSGAGVIDSAGTTVYTRSTGASSTTATNIATTATNQSTGGNETRPVNISLNYIIKV